MKTSNVRARTLFEYSSNGRVTVSTIRKTHTHKHSQVYVHARCMCACMQASFLINSLSLARSLACSCMQTFSHTYARAQREREQASERASERERERERERARAREREDTVDPVQGLGFRVQTRESGYRRPKQGAGGDWPDIPRTNHDRCIHQSPMCVVISGPFLQKLLHNHFITYFFLKKTRRSKRQRNFPPFFFTS